MSVDFTIRPMGVKEQVYSYTQSKQIMSQTGCIGHLRADLNDADGAFFTSWDGSFYSSWTDHSDYLKTEEFQSEFDDVVNSLRFEKNGILSSRSVLEKYCNNNPRANFGNEYGFRVDTEQYSYMMRLNPNKGEHNFYCYCYRRDWLDQHLTNVEHGIRFIDSNYNTLFKIPDGGTIKITYPNGDVAIQGARYIDDYHTEICSTIYHICEFAERMESKGAKVEPIEEWFM